MQKYYELDPLSKDLIIKKMSEAFRRHKNELRKNHYDRFITDEERLRNCPPKIAQEDWEVFITNESKLEAKEKRKRGKKNRSMLEYGHHSGRKSHAMITQEMVIFIQMLNLNANIIIAVIIAFHTNIIIAATKKVPSMKQ